MLATTVDCEMIARVSGDELPGDEATAIGFADDSSSINAVDRVRGLAHMDVLRELADRHYSYRLLAGQAPPRNSAERHLQDTGHVLSFGCCRTDNGSSAEGADAWQ